MKNFIHNGETIVVASPGTTLSGDFVVVGALRGVAVADALITVDCPIVTEGVFELPKEAPLVISAGDKLYWDSGAKVLTKTAAANVLVGVCTTAAVSLDTTVKAYISLEMAAAETGTKGAAVADMAGTLTGTVDGTMVDVAATAAGTAGGSSPTAGQVDTGIAAAVATIVTGVNTQNKEVLTKLNALLAQLRIAGVIA